MEKSLKSVSELLPEKFVVAKYQRGYKWGVVQVRELLEDIEEFYTSSNTNFYCLQPIIVTACKSNGLWEVIDGQQRLTTVYMILESLGISPYQLSYQTRKRSKSFLESIKTLEPFDIDLSDDSIADRELSSEWESYIENHPENNNIDNHHFFKAYHYITNWLDHENTNKGEFSANLTANVKVIWHEIKNDTLKAEQIFINFNKGRIPLDQADLIKAEFILKFNGSFHNKEIATLKAQEFASEWNMIENTLQNDVFWFFISNDVSDKRTYNRIDLIFDLVKGKPKSSIDTLYAYHKLKESMFLESEWRDVKNQFEIIKEWFNDRTTYHLIGFIVCFKILTLNKLYKKYTDEETSKKSFVKFLKASIRSHYESDDNILEDVIKRMQYGDKNCFSLLLLFNIAIEERHDAAFKFPFHRLKQQEWNIEHIHAQNSKDFKFTNEVLVWLNDMEGLRQYFDAENMDFPTSRVQELKDTLDEEKNELTSIQKRLIIDINEKFSEYYDINSISNLCLLDGPTNKGIGNNPFYKKRKEVLTIVETGKNKHNEAVFVPVGTQRVFSKFYLFDDDSVKMSFWGSKERQIYINAIINTIQEFLDENDG